MKINNDEDGVVMNIIFYHFMVATGFIMRKW